MSKRNAQHRVKPNHFQRLLSLITVAEVPPRRKMIGKNIMLSLLAALAITLAVGMFTSLWLVTFSPIVAFGIYLPFAQAARDSYWETQNKVADLVHRRRQLLKGMTVN